MRTFIKIILIVAALAALAIGGYYLYEALLTGNFIAPLAGVPGYITQSALSTVLFIIVGIAMDKLNVKARLDLVSEKYVLSKVHTKYSKIETEQDRLNELINDGGKCFGRIVGVTVKMSIRVATLEDALLVAELAIQMWDDNSVDGLAADFIDYMDNGGAVFMAYHNGAAIGFAQCGFRHDYVEGTETSPVGYLEGVFVEVAYRRQGIARKLVEKNTKEIRKKA